MTSGDELAVQGSLILIVDDTRSNIDPLRSALEKEGYVVSVALNGESAIRRAKASTPDLVLLDVKMQGMDGFDTCKEMRKIAELKEVPVIFITAERRDSQSIIQGFQTGAVDYITKPFILDEVFARVEAHLKTRILLQESRKHAKTQAQHGKALRRLASGSPPNDIFHLLVQNAEYALPGSVCAILIKSQNTERAVSHYIAPNFPLDHYPFDTSLSPRNAIPECCSAIHDGRPSVKTDFQASEDCSNYTSFFQVREIRSWWSWPIKNPRDMNDVVGCLDVFFRESRKPGKRECEYMEMTANLANITIEKMRREADVERTIFELRSLASNLPVMTYRCKNSFPRSFEKVSGNVEKITGYSETDLMGDGAIPFCSLIKEKYQDKIRKKITRAVEQRGAFKVTYELDTESERWVTEEAQVVGDDEQFGANLVGHDGSDLRLQGTIVDITEQKKKELVLESQKNRATQANRQKSVYLATMGHEIRTPLNAIMFYSQLMERDLSLTGEQRRQVSVMVGQGDHLLSVINDVIDLSKVEANQMDLVEVDFDLADLIINGVSGAFGSARSAGGVSFRIECNLSDEYVYGDSTKLRQIVLNLVQNSLKFTEEGEVVLRVEKWRAGEYHFAIEDTGPGIPEKERALLFGNFTQGSSGEKKGGTGIGLAIAHRFIALMGGELDFVPMPERGTRFFFSLSFPVSRNPPPRRKKRAKILGLEENAAIRAMVVDDTESNRVALADALRSAGAQVYEEESGAAALQALKNEQMPDIVFTDIRMPKMDGDELLKAAAAIPGIGEVKWVAVTASVFREQSSIYKEMGFDEFLIKPVRLNRLYQALHDLLGVGLEYDVGSSPKVLKEPRPKDISMVGLPAEIKSELVAAAEGGMATRVDEVIQEKIVPLGVEFAAVADYLLSLSKEYELDEIVKAVEKEGGDD